MKTKTQHNLGRLLHIETITDREQSRLSRSPVLFSRTIEASRPGLRLALRWRREAFRLSYGNSRTYWAMRTYNGFNLALGHVFIDAALDWATLAGLAYPCHKCGRLWPADKVAPVPGDPANGTDKVRAKYQIGFYSGYWEQPIDFDPATKEYKTGPWAWLGPCCEMAHSGEYGDDEDYEEDDYEHEYFDEDELEAEMLDEDDPDEEPSPATGGIFGPAAMIGPTYPTDDPDYRVVP